MRTILALVFALFITSAFGQGAQVVPICGGTLSPPFAIGAIRNGTIDVNGNVCTQSSLSGAGGTGPGGVAMIMASSGNVANATASASLGNTAGKTTYVCGYAVTSTGSTAAAVVVGSITNTINSNYSFIYASVAGVTLANQSLFQNFAPCIPATTANQAISISLPALGAGNTNAAVDIWGYQQ